MRLKLGGIEAHYLKSVLLEPSGHETVTALASEWLSIEVKWRL